MANTTKAIITTSGTNVIDQSVIPYIRSQSLNFSAENLRPYANAYFYFDDTSVQQFVQPSSVLTCRPNYYGTVNPWKYYINQGIFCNATQQYATVIDYSQNTIAYINDNYTSINLTYYGSSSNTFYANSYTVGDIVYLNGNAGNKNGLTGNTWVGEVVFWEPNTHTLVVSTITGTIPTLVPGGAANNRVLYDLQSTQLSNVNNTVYGVEKFAGNGTIWIPIDNQSLTLDVQGNTYTHRSGVCPQPLPNANLSILPIQSPANSSFVGSVVRITSGTGIGQNSIISAVGQAGITGVGTTAYLVVNPPLTVALTGNSLYAIGSCNVDDVGTLAGIFTIPEDANVSFQTGQRTFTITDKASYGDSSAEMKATTTFVAQGFINYSTTTAKTPVVSPVPHITPEANNTLTTNPYLTRFGVGTNSPTSQYSYMLSQTFYCPQPNNAIQNQGIFVSSIELYFQTKPQGNDTKFPVHMNIVTVANGLPTSTILGRASVDWADVVTTDGVHAFPATNVNTSNTKFIFHDPVYLQPSTEYAFQVYTESPSYDVWISQIGETIVNAIGGNPRLISQAPSVGNLFLAQNSSQWTPIQNMMMMFRINKAQFTSPMTMLFNINAPLQTMPYDMAILHSADTTFPGANIDYQMRTFIANTGMQDSGFFEVVNNQPYNFGGDLKNSSLASNRRRVLYAGNANSVQVQVTMSSVNPDVSPFFNADHFSVVTFNHTINPGIISNNNIAITSPGNHINAANIVVSIGAPTGDNPIQATANVLSSGLSGNSVVSINVINPGAGYVIAPTITLTEAAAPANATVVFNGENSSSGGNAGTRYVTQVITLAAGFASGDLQVNMNAVRPLGSDIQVYYKVLGTADTGTIATKPWMQMNKVTDIYSPDQNTPIQLAFNSGGSGTLSYTAGGIQYPLGGAFQQFQIKIALFAGDPTVPPIVQNYTAIAIPAG